jgi:hypothetical protein
MTVKECAAIAAQWVRENEASLPGYLGAYVGGSVAALKPDAEISGGSDMDVYVVADNPPPAKRGKFVFKNALLEISYIATGAIFPAEKALSDYHLANSLSHEFTLDDPSGRLSALQSAVAAGFPLRENISLRRDHAISRVRAGLSGINFAAALPDLTLSWLFPTGITTHAVLVSALRNPTVRLRYLRAREVLLENNLESEHELLLQLSGFSRITRAQADSLLDELEPIFDQAARLGRTPFFFASDISPQSRPAAIDDIRELVARDLHREAMFWIITTYARAMKMLLADAPDEYAKSLPAFENALACVGRSCEADISAAAENVLDHLPQLTAITDSLIEKYGN